jgi:DNA mismatch repair protein MutH
MGSDKVLEKVMFWNMNNQDLEKYKIVFDDTKNKIKKGIYDDFIKISDNKIGHIRPHAQNSKDMMETPQGTFETKKCFWLNAKYIKSQIEMN